MAWFKVDDGFGQHPKVLRIPRKTRMAALGLWLTAGTWSAQQETDGLIPDYMLDEFGADTTLADTLIACGLWAKVSQRDKAGHLWDNVGHDQDSAGYQFHDWGNYQPLRADLETKREEERKRKAEYRAKQKAERATTSGNSSESVPVGQNRTDNGTNAVSEHPDPTRPDPTPNLKQTKNSRGEPPEFVTFYEDAYPKKVDRIKALAAWKKAVKIVDPQLLIERARRYGELSKGKDLKYVKAPSSWLNAGSWDNEELTVTASIDPVMDRYMRLPS